MSEIILSIITSTYNRRGLLKKNIERMLECPLENIEFIIGDNASQDDTYEYLEGISDSRVSIYKNNENMGFENFWLLSSYAKGKYFMFINDRDYIEVADIIKLCNTLSKLKNVDFVSNEKRAYKTGYYRWKDALEIYFQSRHPGTIVYNNEFCKKHINSEVIRNYLLEQKPEKANNYLVLKILLNVDRVYVNSRYMINQPYNRERIAKVRKEYYKGCYVSLEYRMKEYDDWAIACYEYLCNSRIRKIMLAIYKDSLMTVTWEYYMSLKIPGFKKRTGMEEYEAQEWIKNGWKFFNHVIRSSDVKKFEINKEIIRLTILNYINTINKVLEN